MSAGTTRSIGPDLLLNTWVLVIEHDVDGPNSVPLSLGRENPSYGRFGAARRVARTLYLGSAPTLRTGHSGIDDRSVKLGSAQPGETVATFGDALRRLANDATHLYANEGRYWFNAQPSVNRVAKDRAAQIADYEVAGEIVSRVRATGYARGDALRVHTCPTSSADVADERETRLVILGPEFVLAGRDETSRARDAAAAMQESRGETPRRYRNALVFLAPDRTRLEELNEATRLYLAWKSIHEQKDPLNLNAFQESQARTKQEEAGRTVGQRTPETLHWLLVPQQEAIGPVEWRELRLQGGSGEGTLGARALRRLKSEGLLADVYGPTNLRQKLDEVPL